MDSEMMRPVSGFPWLANFLLPCLSDKVGWPVDGVSALTFDRWFDTVCWVEGSAFGL